MKPYKLFVALLLLAVAGCTVKEEEKECPDPLIRITTQWVAGTGVTLPGSYTGWIGQTELQLTDNYNEYPNTYATGVYDLLFYNEPAGISIDATTATTDAATADFIDPRPDHLFSWAGNQRIVEKTSCNITVPMQQRTRDLYVVLRPQGGVADDVQNAYIEIGGVAGSLDLATGGVLGSGVDTRQTFVPGTGDYTASLRLLGVIPAAGQTLTVVLDYGSGDVKSIDVPLTPQNATKFAAFNDNKLVPVTIYIDLSTTLDAVECTLAEWLEGTPIDASVELTDPVADPFILTMPTHSRMAQAVEYVDDNGKTVRANVDASTGKILNVREYPADIVSVALFYNGTRFDLGAAEWNYDAVNHKINDLNLVMVAEPSNLQRANTVAGALAMRYVQVTAVDMSSASNWTPVGPNATTSIFRGSYDGYGLPITNLTINQGNSSYVGLFAYNSGMLRNINLESGTINGQAFVAGICADNRGTIENCSTGAGLAVTGLVNVGGICAWNHLATLGISTVSKCTNRATITSTASVGGGICGLNDNITTSCVNMGPISGGGDAAGICGKNQGRASKIENSINYADIIGNPGSAIRMGGICGNNEGSITDSPNRGKVSGWGLTGGICGRSGTSSITSTMIKNCHNYADVSTSLSNYGGGICSQNYGTISSCNNYAAQVSSWGYVGGICGVNAGASCVIEDCVNNASVASTGNTGTATEVYTGGICGQNNGIVTRCTNNGAKVTSESPVAAAHVGGICGSNYTPNDAVMQYCVNNADVISKGGYVGGIAGSNIADGNVISSCTNNGNVTAAQSCGGIVGQNDATVKWCVNNGAKVSVQAGGFVGGICAVSTSSVVNSCWNKAEVSSTGTDDSKEVYAGGICGYMLASTTKRMESCVNQGNVIVPASLTRAYAGGICGATSSNGIMMACYNTGSVTGPAANTGSIRGVQRDAGVVTFNFCYWGGGSAAMSSGPGGTFLAGCTQFGSGAAGTGGQHTGWPVSTNTGWTLSSAGGNWLALYSWTGGGATQQYPQLYFPQ